MIPLIEARRHLMPPAGVAYGVSLIDSHQAANTAGFTRSSLALGTATSTRQFWLVTAVTTEISSGGVAAITATLGGNTLTARRTIDATTPGSSGLTVSFLSLEGYGGDTTADLVLTYSRNAWIAQSLIRVDDAVDPTVEVDFASLNTNTAGTWNENITGNDRGVVFGAAAHYTTGGCSLSGMENVDFSGVTNGHGRNKVSVGWDPTETTATVAATVVGGSSTSDEHLYAFVSYAPAVV